MSKKTSKQDDNEGNWFTRRCRLQVVKKVYCGITVGYVVGWWVRRSRWLREDSTASHMTFRSIRQGLVFPTVIKAKRFRDGIEKQRANSALYFESVDDDEGSPERAA